MLPFVVIVAGGILILLAVVQAVLAFRATGSILLALLDLLFIGGPGGMLIYTGYWLPQSEITKHHYPRIIAWVLGGIAVMFGFILLRDLHPGVTVEWANGTQAIALMLGSIGGLIIGIEETKATIRTNQLEAYTQRLETQEQELKRQNEQLERFAGVLSHDLRNPLSVARGRLKLAQADHDSEHLDAIGTAHERIDTLIEDLLTLAQQGEQISDVEPVDIGPLSSDCWATVGTGNAALETEAMRPIMADQERLRQLVENLFRNSVEHGSTGSRTGADDIDGGEPDLTITVGELDDGTGFYVEDDGPGIPEIDRETVFESGYTTGDGGTGFGLAIVKEIAGAHGWRIRATSSESGGARFEITGVEFAP
ncbi:MULTISPECIES: sensor histidine kinase [Haloarcula]|uniref:histidine kinase n=1 Tax=Haloarcula amylolytica JCM 13557 TaxID=1227452 RepID=M0KVJ2_9EURY|nr:HAMP domain-containing sensor histidine kinase [Haloarcula amylolytica]EMA25322.1 membrane associated histidine kinase [Haloarcula amylolytica JCM 13557]